MATAMHFWLLRYSDPKKKVFFQVDNGDGKNPNLLKFKNPDSQKKIWKPDSINTNLFLYSNKGFKSCVFYSVS